MDLLDEKSPVAGTDAQERLNSAYEYIKSLVNILNERGGQELIKAWLGSISKLEVLEFIEPDKGKAIRMFQSLNDRGVQLTKLDIVKSLLVYYSNRYLNGELDDFIVKNFGQIFKCFNTVRRLARETGYQIDHINGKDFSEDAVLRYHYFSFDSSNHDTKGGDINSPTTEEVLKDFLKETLKNLRSDQTKLKAFISDYTSDLKAFFDGLKGLVSETRNNREIFLLFVFQGVSTALYPLIIRLYMMQQLFVSTEDGSGRVLFDIIELTDFRVFKLRGTTPAVGIVKLTRSLPRLTAIEISDRLKEFCQRFMPDTLMRTRLLDQAIYPNYGLVRLLLDLDENNRELLHLLPLSLAELIELKRLGLTVEHIFPQTFEFFDVTNYGFDEDADYSSNNHFLGNLTLLEGSINTACNNRRVEEKMSATNLYSASKMTSPRHLAARHLNDCFSKDHLLKRGREITETILRRWSI